MITQEQKEKVGKLLDEANDILYENLDGDEYNENPANRGDGRGINNLVLIFVPIAVLIDDVDGLVTKD